MAVDIPVVIDIDKAFEDAAKQVKTASAPLRRSIDELNERLSDDIKRLNSMDPTSPMFKYLAKDIQDVTMELGDLNDMFAKFSSNQGSIKMMSSELASLSRRWEEMGAAQKFTSDGKLSADAKALLAEYKNVTAEIQRSGKSLSQLEAEDRRILELNQKKRQAYKDENRILNSTLKTMNVLQAQERILSSRLSATPVGTQKYKDLAVRLEEVRKEISLVEAQAKRGGASFRSMGDGAAAATSKINMTNTALSSQKKILSMLSTYLSGYALIFGSIRFAHNIRETTAELEMQRVALGGILRDTERASELFREIKAAALKSPFEIKDLVTYTKQLSAYRIETDKLFDVTMQLADVSAGLGVDMNRLILAYGQVRAASVLRGQELRQFTEAGIPLVELLAEKFEELGRKGTTTADVFELISKRAVPFKMIEEIFNDMTKAGGMFYNMQEKQSETLKGQWMKLRDAITIMYDEIGNTKAVHDAMTFLIQAANNLTRSWRDVTTWAKALIATIVTFNVVSKASVAVTTSMTTAEAARLAVTKAQTLMMPKAIAAILGDTAAKKVSRTVTKALTVAQYQLATATTIVEKAFWKLAVTLLSNPYAIAAAGIVALGAAIFALSKKNKEAAITVDELGQSISKFNSFAKKKDDVETLIEEYDRLSKKADKTKEEIEKLNRVTNELAKTFPSAQKGIDKETGALIINIEKVKELTLAEQKLELARLSRDKKRTQRRVKELENERNGLLEMSEAGGKWISTALPGGGTTKEWHKFTEDELARFGDRVNEIREELDPLKSDLERIIELEDSVFGAPGGQGGGGRSGTKEFVGWKQVLSDIQKEKLKVTQTPIYTDDDIQNMEDMDVLWKATKKGIEEATIKLGALKAIQDTLVDPDLKKQNEEAIDDAQHVLDFWNEVKDRYHFVYKKDSGDAYKKDSFITLMENRMKFMQDFKKGYDDLNRYLSAQDSLGKQSEIMLGRGLSLNIDPAEQKRAAKELSDWYQEQIDRVLEEMRKKGLKANNLTEVLSQQITGDTNKAKMTRDYQALLQSLWDAKTDFDTSTLKKELEDEMKRLKDDLKRSDTARNFFQNILDLTGDQDLAANLSVSVYGGAGEDFKEKLQKQLDKAFSTIDTTKISDGVYDELKKAFEVKDFDTILKYIDAFPDEVRETLKQIASDDEKYTADLMKNFADLISKYGDTTQKIATIRARAENEIQKVREALDKSLENEKLTPEQRKALQERADEIVKALEAARDLDIFKQTPDYIKFFAEISIMTAKQAASVRGELRNAYLKAFQDGAISADELRRNLRAIDEQYKKLGESATRMGAYLKGGFEGANNKLQEFADNITVLAAKLRSGKELDEDEQDFASRMLQVFGTGKTKGIKSFQELMDNLSKNGKGLKEAGEALQEMGDGMSETAAKGPMALQSIKDISATITSAVTGTQSIIDQLNELRGPDKQIGGWFKYVSEVTGHLSSGLEKLLSGDPIGAIGSVVQSFISIFTIAHREKVKKLNDEIDRQQELIDKLGRSDNRLEKAMEKAFGSDYISNYNEQLKNLMATQAAYEAQAAAERNKGKSSDEKKAKEYENAAMDVAEQIADMQGQLAEYFTQTDLASAAKDFASSWIEAYKEFGSTTDAMKEKFQEMVQSMIEQSIGAKIMQTILQPMFDSIDEMAKTGGELSAEEIAKIGQMAPEYIDKINEAMTTMMNQLAAAGYNVRQGVSGLTGISRNIAGASEESITGLAAGINTQNFYMSLISQNVAAILQSMTGGEVQGASNVAVPDTYKETMMEYAMHIPTISQNIADIKSMLNEVIRPTGYTVNKVVHAYIH